MATLLHRIMAVHREWLIGKGYAEEQLTAPIKPGTFADGILQHMLESIRQSLEAPGIQKFQIGLTKDFGKEDRVQFTFFYEFNPDTIGLNLEKMTAGLRQFEQPYPISRNTRHELPSAAKAYQSLCTLEQQQALLKIRGNKQAGGGPSAGKHLYPIS